MGNIYWHFRAFFKFPFRYCCVSMYINLTIKYSDLEVKLIGQRDSECSLYRSVQPPPPFSIDRHL